MDWKKWCGDIWAQYGNAWIERTGQDHYYRAMVVIPAMLQVVGNRRIASLVDVGSGDGYSTELLLAALDARGIHPPTSVTLIDQSPEQLQRARRSPHLAIAQTFTRDILAEDWEEEVTELPSPALFISIFVLQEIPVLAEFFARLSKALRPDDTFIAVIVHPDYSTRLTSQGKLHIVSRGEEGQDWETAGKYPIGVEDGTIYLPHFQRSVATYARIASDFGLHMQTPIPLQVPDTADSHRIFDTTVYGDDITRVQSGALLIFNK